MKKKDLQELVARRCLDLDRLFKDCNFIKVDDLTHAVWLVKAIECGVTVYTWQNRFGHETGPRARPMDPDWAAMLVRQCRHAGVPVFVKGGGKEFPKCFQKGENLGK